MSDNGLPRPSLASECTESLASRPLDSASAGVNAEDRGTAHLDAEIERLNASLRAEGAAAERERLRLELLAEAKAEDRLLRRATLVRLPGSVLRDFARRLEAP